MADVVCNMMGVRWGGGVEVSDLNRNSRDFDYY